MFHKFRKCPSFTLSADAAVNFPIAFKQIFIGVKKGQQSSAQKFTACLGSYQLITPHDSNFPLRCLLSAHPKKRLRKFFFASTSVDRDLPIPEFSSCVYSAWFQKVFILFIPKREKDKITKRNSFIFTFRNFCTIEKAYQRVV